MTFNNTNVPLTNKQLNRIIEALIKDEQTIDDKHLIEYLQYKYRVRKYDDVEDIDF